MAKKRKIGLVLDTSLDPVDGVQQYVIAVGEWLRGQGNDVHYLVGETRHRDELSNVHSLARNISVRFNGNRTTVPLPTSKRKLRVLLERECFDVLHVQIPHSPFMAQRLILAASPKTAVIGTFHIAAYSRLVTVGNWLLGWWLRPSLKRLDTILAVSQAASDFARQTFHVQTQVLPNVIDYASFQDAKPFQKYQDDTLTILFLGRLVERKGCQVLLEAVARLAKESDLPKFRVVICGKGHQAAQLQVFINKHGLTEIVEMAGFVSEADKPRYYASADITVFPSSGGESFGIVLLEAMASGHAAVLAGDNPGYRSVMEPQPGQLFNPTDVAELTKKLRVYLTDTQLRQKAGIWGEQYTQEFDTAVVGWKLIDIYERALRKRRGA